MRSIPIIKWLFFAVLKSVGLLLGVLVRYRSWLWDFLTFGTKFFFFSLEGLDDEGNPKGNYGFIFFPSAFYSMVTSDSDTDSNALYVLLLVG